MFWIAISIFLPLVFSDENHDPVLRLTDSNFYKTLAKYDAVVVSFYAPRCSKCDSLVPEFVKAAQQIYDKVKSSPKPRSIQFGSVNAGEQHKITKDIKIGKYPTIILYVSGKATSPHYRGELHSEAIQAWIDKKFFNPTEILNNVEDVLAFTKKSDFLVIGLYSNTESAEAKAYEAVASMLSEKYPMAISSAPSVIEYVNSYMSKLQTTPNEQNLATFIIYKTFDEGLVQYQGDHEIEPIQQFIRAHTQPLVREYPWSGGQSHSLFVDDKQATLFALIRKSNIDHVKHIELLGRVAKQFRQECVFAYVDMDSEEGSARLRKLFNLGLDLHVPTFRILTVKAGIRKKFQPDNETDFSESNIQGTLTDVLSGSHPQLLKTEKLPANWDQYPVKILVGSNYHRVVRDKTKSVFVKFYSPGCMHCVHLAPVWDHLALEFSNRNDIIIAEINADHNEVDGVTLRGLPTLLFYSNINKTPVQYNGPRDLKELKSYINGHHRMIDEL